MTTTWADGASVTLLGDRLGRRLAVLAGVQHLQHELFADDASGPTETTGATGAGVTTPTGLGHDAPGCLVRELNELRATLGWLPVDAGGRWCWPE